MPELRSLRVVILTVADKINCNMETEREKRWHRYGRPEYTRIVVVSLPWPLLLLLQEATRPFSRLNRARTANLLMAREQRSRREVEKAQNASLDERGIDETLTQEMRGLNVRSLERDVS